MGLSTDVLIGVGAFDAHMGAVGGQIEPYHLSKVMGTSTCDMLVAPTSEVEGKLVKGICGQVPGSIIPGMMGMEAGQSAFGDAYAWFKNIHANNATVSEYRVDETNNNSYTAWKQMGSPQQVSEEQFNELENAGKLKMITTAETLKVKNGNINYQLELPSEAVTLLKVSW